MRGRYFRFLVLLAGLALLLLVGASAQIAVTPGGTCADALGVLSDGRLHSFDLPGEVSRWFQFQARADHSYSIDVYTQDGFSGQANIVLVTRDSCGSPVAVPTTDRRFTLPGMKSGFGFRRTFIASTSGIHWIEVDHNIDIITHAEVVTHPTILSVSETTLFNPRWSTFGGFSTSWGFHNTANPPINVTFKVISTTGSELSNTTFAVAGERVVFRSTSGLGIAASQAGNAILAHDGPPGAIQADGFMVSPDGLTGFPVKFEPMREESIF